MFEDGHITIMGIVINVLQQWSGIAPIHNGNIKLFALAGAVLNVEPKVALQALIARLRVAFPHLRIVITVDEIAKLTVLDLINYIASIPEE